MRFPRCRNVKYLPLLEGGYEIAAQQHIVVPGYSMRSSGEVSTRFPVQILMLTS